MENLAGTHYMDYFSSCIVYNIDRRGEVRSKIGEDSCFSKKVGITLENLDTPSKLVKSILRQHYDFCLEVHSVQAGNTGQPEQIKKLMEQNDNIVSELNKLKEAAILAKNTNIIQPLEQLIKYGDWAEWSGFMNNLLDDLICGMNSSCEHHFSESLYYVRALQKFFSALSGGKQ